MADFQANEQAKRHRFLLSIDGGGGMRGLSPLFIIKEILYRIQMKGRLNGMPLACDIFDLAGGTGTGGLIVIMLFRLKMDIEPAIRAYRELTEKVASAKGKGPMKSVQAVRSSQLKEYFLEIIGKHVQPEARAVEEIGMLEEDLNSMAFVSASLEEVAFPELLRTWRPLKNASCDCTIINAVMATCAERPTFEEVVIKDNLGITKTYNRTDLHGNNPLQYVWREGKIEFHSDISCVVSVGTGVGATVSSVNYLVRLDVDKGLQDLSETKKSLGVIQIWTMQYMATDNPGDKEIDDIVQKYLTVKGNAVPIAI